MTDIEFEYADYCINKLRESVQAADDIDWQNRKTHRYDDRLSNKELEEVRSILVSENWIERYQRTTLYSLNKSKLTILKEYGSYSNYCKSLVKETQLLKSKLDDKTQLETEVLKLQKESLEKSSKIILDVFEIEDYNNPILKYKISVVDKFIILVSNKDVPSTDTGFVVHDDKIREKLVLYDLTDEEKFDFGSYLTHKFKIKHFSRDYLYLNLTENDLIKLGFIEPKRVVSKSEKLLFWIKKFHKAILWVLGGILLLLSIMVAGFAVYDRLNKPTEQKESTQPINKQNIDDNNVPKNDS